MRAQTAVIVIAVTALASCGTTDSQQQPAKAPEISTPNPCQTANGGCDVNATCAFTTTVTCTCLDGFTGDGTSCTATNSANPNGKQVAPLEGDACDDKCLEGLSCLGTKTETYCRVPCDEDASVCSAGTLCTDFAGIGYLFACLPTVASGEKCDGILATCEKGLGCFDGSCATARKAGETCTAKEECDSGMLCIAGANDVGYCRVDCSASSSACASNESCKDTTDGGAVCMPG